jgi:enamine deaminase RidA (YjgF/YER057c/UK114 family)
MTAPAQRRLDPPALPAPVGNYTHGVEVSGVHRVVYVSGQVPWADDDGVVPADFEAQCRLVWRNILAVLAEAGMGVEHLVKVTTYLSGREHRAVNAKVRQEVLGGHRPALTIIITGIYDEAWLLEIDAVAAA